MVAIDPIRRLAAGTLVSSLGTGAWYASWALFLTRSVGLSPAQVGLGLTVAGAAGLLAATPLGWLADRVGPREVYAAALAVQGAASFAYLRVEGFGAFLAVASVAELARGGAGGARNALVLSLSPDDELGALGTLRSLSHVGWALGALGGAVVIGVDSRPAYVALLIANGTSFLVYTALVASVPRPAAAKVAARGLRVVGDRPYVTLAALTGMLALCWAMLSSGLPLWVALHTDAPRSISAVIVVLNSLAIAAFQVPVSRRMPEPLTAARGAMLSGSALALSCGLFALTYHTGGAAAVALLLLAGAVHVAGELLFVAASWGLSIPLMPRDAAGEYQGVFATGEATALLLAPALMTTLVAGWGQPGWLVLAALFLVPAAAIPPVTRWALRSGRSSDASGRRGVGAPGSPREGSAAAAREGSPA
jgi:MFS-type transporter involved in bile tolerance (Atg22 family)